jgi:hypothetical protein
MAHTRNELSTNIATLVKLEARRSDATLQSLHNFARELALLTSPIVVHDNAQDYPNAHAAIKSQIGYRWKGKGRELDGKPPFYQKAIPGSLVKRSIPEGDLSIYTDEDLRRYISTYPWTEHSKSIIRPLLESEAISHMPGSLFHLQSEAFPRQHSFLKAQIVGVGEEDWMISRRCFNVPEEVEDLWNCLPRGIHHGNPISEPTGQLIEIQTSIPVVFTEMHMLFHSLVNMDNVFEKLEGKISSNIYAEIPGAHPLRGAICVNLQYFRIVRDPRDLRDWEQSFPMKDNEGSEFFFSRSAAVVVFWSKPHTETQSAQPWKVLSLQSSEHHLTEVENNSIIYLSDGYDAFFHALYTQYGNFIYGK